MGVEFDVYHSMVYFLIYLNCENLYGVVELYDVVDVDIGHDYVLVLIWVKLVNNHDDAC